MWLKFAFQKLSAIFGWGDAWWLSPTGQVFDCGANQEHHNWVEQNMNAILAITPQIQADINNYLQEYPDNEKDVKYIVKQDLLKYNWQRLRFRKMQGFTNSYEFYVHTNWSPKAQNLIKDFVIENIQENLWEFTTMVIQVNMSKKDFNLKQFMENN